MSKDKYFKAFEELGIELPPLMENYTPDLFAERLMSRYTEGKGQISFSPYIEYDERK